MKLSAKIALVVVCVTLFGCSNYLETRTVNKLKSVVVASETTIDAVIDDFKRAKIILLGEDHVTVNEELFVANNIQKLHDAGFRYLFLEGGADLINYLPESDGYGFYMYYPWMLVGWRFEQILFFKAIADFNGTLPENEQIKVLSAEPYSDEEHYYDKNVQWMNFRDGSAAETIIGVMDGVPDNTKVLIIYGSWHGQKIIEKKPPDPFRRKYDWLPLAYRLKGHYGEKFLSYMFFYSDAVDFLTESKLVLSNNLHSANLVVSRYKKRYDGFIVEPKKLSGTFYQYNPINENSKFIFTGTNNYALYNRNAIPDTTYQLSDSQGQFLMALYYLKLYFGDKFDYAFWRNGSSKDLLAALDELYLYAFADGSPSNYIKTNLDNDTLMLFHKYMAGTLLHEFNESRMSVKGIREEYLSKAKDLFPEDLWALYWLGYTAAEKKQYTKALDYFQLLFKAELALNMESLPFAYRKAALCAGKVKNEVLEAEYNGIADSLYNEYNVYLDGSVFTRYSRNK
jgi:hypothetical protein